MTDKESSKATNRRLGRIIRKRREKRKRRREKQLKLF